MANGVWTSGETEVRGMWVLSPAIPEVRRRAQKVGVFSGREYLVRGRRLFPGRTFIVVY